MSLTIIGVDASGSYLPIARRALVTASIIYGADRQLDLVEMDFSAGTVIREWPRPLAPALEQVLVEAQTEKVVVLGTGDPMLYGIGGSLLQLYERSHLEQPLEVEVYPAPSALSLACAKLHWPVQDAEIVSTVGRPLGHVIRAVDSGARTLVFVAGGFQVPEIAELLVSGGHSQAEMWALCDLGTVQEKMQVLGPASTAVNQVVPAKLVMLAIEPHDQPRSLAPGLADTEYQHDGQITKQIMRAVTVSALEPHQHDVMWDIGGGSGSISIEFLRLCPLAQVRIFEQNEERRAQIQQNAALLGAPQLQISGAAPAALAEAMKLERPNKVFIGGGLTVAGLLHQAWKALLPGGTLVVNAVTLETKSLVSELRKTYGGQLAEISVAHEHPVGGFTTLKPALPVLQWKTRKPTE